MTDMFQAMMTRRMILVLSLQLAFVSAAIAQAALPRNAGVTKPPMAPTNTIRPTVTVPGYGSLRVAIFCHALYNSLIVLALRFIELPAPA